ncbi:alpha-galactosidase (plasmid) [Pedobacter sp. BS3]|uniref:alpha-galactosidase n=1 Tax=Pedobacter sp. BS3 TaxID=2567937 RepID=UPI0011ECBA49|nr:alpha-galactosidase [Pedobacter sp. BS3]TZF85576.1 alpha-galactosidase [Pedobacter sp. BS3]
MKLLLWCALSGISLSISANTKSIKTPNRETVTNRLSPGSVKICHQSLPDSSGRKTSITSLCSALIRQDTLVIKNDVITLYYSLANGNVAFTGYQLTDSEKVNFTHPVNDLNVSTDTIIKQPPLLQTAVNRHFKGEKDFLEISLLFHTANMDIKKVWEIYPGIPAIATYYLFNGKADHWLSPVKSGNSTTIIETSLLFNDKQPAPYFGAIPLDRLHWKAKVIAFTDATDHHNNLVNETSFIPYISPSAYSGNVMLLQNKLANRGIFIVKSAPLNDSQQAYPGYDFVADCNKILIAGSGILPADIKPGKWVKTYAYTMGFGNADETGILLALRSWQKTARALHADRDEMIMSNTWGDRSKDAKMNETFIMQELEAASRLGITYVQLDDGWQEGLSRNSAEKHGKRWNNWTAEDWQPSKTRFPNGLNPIVEKARSLGVELALWFNPGSGNHYSDWQTSANILLNYYHKYNIRVFKIDGVDLADKESETNLGKFLQYITDASDGKITFNLDVTAGRRGGFFFFNQYGNIFLENRYTDWANYYPYQTLRNLWDLSRYMPVEKLQAEWLNSWRNINKYPLNDPLAPGKINWEYQMATTFIAQPLAWMEVSALPKEAFQYAEVLKKYRSVQHELHNGLIMPVGDEPDGTSWTGFQSIDKNKGYFLLFRENSESSEALINVHLPAGSRVKLTPVFGQGKAFKTHLTKSSQIKFTLPQTFSYALYRYEIY